MIIRTPSEGLKKSIAAAGANDWPLRVTDRCDGTSTVLRVGDWELSEAETKRVVGLVASQIAAFAGCAPEPRPECATPGGVACPSSPPSREN